MEIKVLSGWSVTVIRQILGWVTRVLLVCLLLLGLVAGINWMSNLDWGTGSAGGTAFVCNSGQKLHYADHHNEHGQFAYTAVWCQ